VTWSHGWSGYVHYGCGCDVCTMAHTNYQWWSRKRRAERLAADPTLAPHGEKQTYSNWGCRCAACRAANARSSAEYRAQRKERG
jgi:hypothetical protein